MILSGWSGADINSIFLKNILTKTVLFPGLYRFNRATTVERIGNPPLSSALVSRRIVQDEQTRFAGQANLSP
ncbi:MAG: hypothetical protein JXA77_03905 [Bacteroidales bacterium]|nr:hypothetical protein [Bacteroidales bacterium]MBN2820334.1 hypothetical protein [Bacteroidales bacterium]